MTQSPRHNDLPTPANIPFSVFVLGLAVFCVGTTEVLVAGLLPMLSHDLHVSIPTAGLLISGYAMGVVIGGPLLTIAFLRIPRKTALILLLCLFIIGQVFGAVATNYGLLMASRVIASLAQGALFGIGSLLAVDLAGDHAKGKALAIMFGGLTMANVIGMPLGTGLGQLWGWRASFWAVAILALISLVGVLFIVPRQPAPKYGGIRPELTSFANPQVWLALSVTALSQAGLFAVFSYFTPLFTEVGGFSERSVPFLQMLFGAGCLAGTFIGAKYTDRNLHKTLIIGLTALTISIAVFGGVAHHKAAVVITLVLFGIAAFSINPALQAQVIIESPDAPTLTTTTNTSAFNLGNTVGPWLGGLVITQGWGFAATAQVGAGLAFLALVVALLSMHVKPRTFHTAQP
jgi:DHA1 family inner membrane transport protein